MPFRTYPTLALFLCLTSLLAPAKRLLVPDDIYRTQEVHEARVSPDGKWIAYVVTTIDRDADKLRNTIWMVNWEGTQDVQLTFSPVTANSPRWSPDGKYLSFLAEAPADAKSDDKEDAKSQVWLLDRRGGSPRQLTDVKSEIEDYAWSPDSKRLLLTMQESDDEADEAKKDGGKTPKPKAPKPIVTERYHFKEDIEGYLTGAHPPHLYLFTIENKKLEPLTGTHADDKTFAERDAAWSPDGSQIAFVSNHAKEPDQTGTEDIFVMHARGGDAPRLVHTTFSPNGQRLEWSPDGTLLAFLQGFEPKFNAYNCDRLAVVPVAGGSARVLTEKLDRAASHHEFTPDGSALTFLVEDDQHSYLSKVAVSGGTAERVSHGDVVFNGVASGGGHNVAVGATDQSPFEIYALENGEPRKLTSHNDDLLSELRLGAVEDMNFHSKDGTEIHGLLIKPPDYVAGKKYPTILWIHGGPNGQDEHALDFGLYPLQLERQLFAARGYAVLAINYRGSSGRGAEFSRSIWGDWGNKEVADLLAGADYAVKQGIADPDRLGIGGWSYGGILTDYTIASDPRFKVAMSGAGSANQISMFGSDQYVLQYQNELGPPWKNEALWIKLSYPFFHADRIHTPTLFMGGQNDFNVPIIGGEQMYESLRTLGVPTQLIVYPTQFHIFTRPSYIHDRLERYGAWFDKYLKASH